MTQGEKVRAARKAVGMSQKVLAEKIGVSEITVLRLEQGRREANMKELEKIANALNVPISELLDNAVFTSDVSLWGAPKGKKIVVPLLSPELTACCGSGIPTYSEIQNSPEKTYVYTIEELGGVYDEMRPPYAVRADGSCLEKSRIFDGDILIFNPALEPRQGQICIVCWGGSLSAKKVVRNVDGSIKLYSDVDEFSISAKEASDPERFSIWGPVIEKRQKIR